MRTIGAAARVIASPEEAAPRVAPSRLDSVRAERPLEGLRVLIVVENLPLPFDRRVWQESRTLVAAGASVDVICPAGRGYEARYEEIEGVRIHRHPLPFEASGALGYILEYGAALFHETRLAWKIWRTRGFDIVHGCNPPDLIFLVALQFRLFGVRFLFDHHDINPELFEAKFGRRGPLWALVRVFERLTFAAARVVISTNESYAQIARQRGGKRAEDVFVVRSGPDLSRLRPMTPNPRWRNGRAHMVGYLGVMGDQEGLDLLLEAARELVHGRGLDIQFVLVGGGPAREGLIAQAAALGLSEHVSFPGRVPDRELFEVLSTADVCVNPDRVTPMNDKSTMNKILEYMAFSRPIVQFDVTEGRASAGTASLYARPNDTSDLAARIAELLADPERRARMGREGRWRIETALSWDHQIEKLIAAYRRCAGR